jgi:U3 small nucleolar RNA-associated protein 20
MAPSTLSGRIIKTRNVKRGTTTQRNHRWESFTTKIAKLNSLDPIRKVRRYDIDTEDLSTTTSYFKAGLEKWAELNVSQDFIAFSHEVLPLSDSLSQILHSQDKIMGILVLYLEKKDKNTIQALLELVADFAHDLGAQFEKHYAKALELITSIAGIPQDADIIEWSFTCLAFMFKYLAKLLIPDLRPTYDLMSPLMGKDRVPPHIARFAAEAMSFLVKKAAAPAHRERALPLIISHAKKDLESIKDTRQAGLYYHGIMTLFAEAIRGNGLNVHMSGSAIFQSLFMGLNENDFENGSQWPDVICGVITSLVHHTSSNTFTELQDTILELSNNMAASFTEHQNIFELSRLLLSARTLGIMAGVRKGSRISNWPAVVETLSNSLGVVSKNSSMSQLDGANLCVWKHLVLSVSITLQYAPMAAMIPVVSVFMESLTKDPLAKHFLTFCTYLSEAEEGPERFKSIALPYFKRYDSIVSRRTFTNR